MSKTINETDKFCYWEFMVYPESMPFDSYSQLINWFNENHFCGCISPLHNPDDVLYDENGEVVEDDGDNLHQIKPHYHVALYFKGPRKKKSVDFLLEPINPSKRKYPINDITQYCRYMLHLDNPEKEQFLNGEEIVNFGSFDSSIYTLDNFLIQKNIIDIIRECSINNFHTLIDYLYVKEYPNAYFEYLRKNTYFINSYLKG